MVSGGGGGGRMGRGIRRHELQLQALGMWKLHGDYNLQKKPIRWHHRASGRSRSPETSPRVSSDPGVLQAGCHPVQTLWKFAAWAWVPTSPDTSLRPASPPPPMLSTNSHEFLVCSFRDQFRHRLQQAGGKLNLKRGFEKPGLYLNIF